MNKRAHLIIYGDVTGVGFRAWTYRNAIELELTGWVRNVERGKARLSALLRSDGGQVEAVFEGEKDKIEEMIARCKKGPEVAWVEKVEVEWGKATGEYEVFSIKY